MHAGGGLGRLLPSPAGRKQVLKTIQRHACAVAVTGALCRLLLVESEYCTRFSAVNARWRPRTPSATACWWKGSTAGSLLLRMCGGGCRCPLPPPSGGAWVLQAARRSMCLVVAVCALCHHLLVESRDCWRFSATHVWWCPWAPSATTCWWKCGTASSAVAHMCSGGRGCPLPPPCVGKQVLQAVRLRACTMMVMGALYFCLLVECGYCRRFSTVHTWWRLRTSSAVSLG